MIYPVLYDDSYSKTQQKNLNPENSSVLKIGALKKLFRLI
jgi:hypothetical protein